MPYLDERLLLLLQSLAAVIVDRPPDGVKSCVAAVLRCVRSCSRCYGPHSTTSYTHNTQLLLVCRHQPQAGFCCCTLLLFKQSLSICNKHDEVGTYLDIYQQSTRWIMEYVLGHASAALAWQPFVHDKCWLCMRKH